jgi:hypothetical protein
LSEIYPLQVTFCFDVSPLGGSLKRDGPHYELWTELWTNMPDSVCAIVVKKNRPAKRPLAEVKGYVLSVLAPPVNCGDAALLHAITGKERQSGSR